MKENFFPSILKHASSLMDGEVTEHQTKERLRTRWTASLDKVFADLVVEQIQLGNRPNNIFDKKTWGHIRDEFNKQTSLNFNNNQLRKHLDVLRIRYNQVKSTLVHNDLVMEDSGCLSFDLWDGIGVSSGPEPVKTKDCPIYEQLCIIFADDGADGRYAQSSHYKDIKYRSNGSNATGLTSYQETEAHLQNNHALPLASFKSMEANVALAEKGRSNLENKRKRSLDAQQIGESQRDLEALESMAQALLDMIAASKLRTFAAASNKEKFSITNCIKALDEMEGVAESLYFATLDLFDDQEMRETFISLKCKERRLEWLQEKCCSSSLLKDRLCC